jgi:hypothetical protein
MLKLIKRLLNRKTTLEQQIQLCAYLDNLQSKQLKGAVNK